MAEHMEKNTTNESCGCDVCKSTKVPDDGVSLLQNELSAQKDTLLRLAAEYDNYRKRTERDKSLIYQDATCAAIREILPVADSIDRAIASCEKCEEEYLKGLNMIKNQLCSALEKMEVSSFGAVGDPFSPDDHDAILHIQDENLGDGVVVEIFQRGYRFGDKIIRHAIVTVAN